MNINPVSQSKLRVGFLVDSGAIEKNTLDLMDAIANNDHLFDSQIIIELIKEKPIISSFIFSIKKPLRFILTQIINKLEASRIRNNPIYEDYFLTFSPADILSRRPSFSDASLGSLHSKKIDIYINYSSSSIPNLVFHNSTYGVIKLSIGDSSLDKNLFVGFLDVLYKRPATSLTILREDRDSRLDSVIRSGKMMTRSLWHHNRAAIFKKSNAFILRFLKDLQANTSLATHPIDLFESAEHEVKISSFHIAKYISKVYLSSIIPALTKVFQSSKKLNRWSVAYAKGAGLEIDLSSATEIKNLPGRFFADPFIISHNNRNICFVEDFFYAESKGKISAIEILDNGYQVLGVVLEEQFHLSYPYIFEHEDRVYMIPETNEANEIRLYQAVDFPLIWELKQVLMQNVSAVDTSIFQEGVLWYMLTNICSSDADDHSSELHVFYSDKPDSGNWTPIQSNNPVIFNSQEARNGGFFELGNQKYRVNQVQGFSHYGRSLAVNLIKNISQDIYEEERVFEIQPDFREDIISTHHYHTNGKFIVFDYCKNEKII